MSHRELIRLSLYYAEQYQEEFAQCVRRDKKEYAKAMSFVRQAHKFRMKHFGKTALEAHMDRAKIVSITEFMKEPTHADE